MLIKTKKIVCQTKEIFNSWKLPTGPTDEDGDILWSAIVFIENTAEIWTHGKLFGGLFSNENANKIDLTVSGVTKSLSLDGHTQSYTTLTGSSNIKNQAILSSGVENQWILKTLGKNAFSNDDYLPIDGVAESAKRVVNDFIINIKSSPFITFNGSEAKTINFMEGDNISIITDDTGTVTISADAGEDTVNTAGATNLEDTKLFLVGAQTQTEAPPTYSNQRVYIGSDNALYSEGKKVSITGHTHPYLPLSGGTMQGPITMPNNTYIYGGSNASGQSILHFDGNRTVLGSIGELTTKAPYIRSKTSHITVGNGNTEYTVWDSGNDGEDSGLDADLLDGIDSFLYGKVLAGVGGDADLAENLPYFCGGKLYKMSNVGINGYGTFMQFGYGGYYAQFNARYNRIAFRSIENGTPYGDWREFAFLDSTVEAANKLATARTLWGQPFDGTANVSGNLSNVPSIINEDYFHRIDLGYPGNNKFDFYEYGGMFNFYRNRGEATDNRLLICRIETYNSYFRGNLGIGTTSPEAKLHVIGNTIISGAATIQDGIVTDYTGGAWLTMATRSNLIRADQDQGESSAHALYRVKSYNGDAVVFGGLGNSVGFYGFYKSTINNLENHYDWNTRWDTTNGKLYTSNDIYVNSNIVYHAGNFSSAFDGRYVKKAGDTMTGVLSIKSNIQNSFNINNKGGNGYSIVNFYVDDINKARHGYSPTFGSYIQNIINGYYINIRDAQELNLYLNNKYKFWHDGNDGSDSGLDADLLDGLHGSSFCRNFLSVNGEDMNTIKEPNFYWGYNVVNSAHPSMSNFIILNYSDDWGTQLQFVPNAGSKGKAFMRFWKNTGGVMDSDWREFAFLDSTVASANKLATPVTLWGNQFDGTNNVNGSLTGVGNINSSNSAFLITKEGLGANYMILSLKSGQLNINAHNGENILLGYRGTAGYSFYAGTDGGDSEGSLIGAWDTNRLYTKVPLGVGTSTPKAELHVVGKIRTDSFLLLANNCYGSSWGHGEGIISLGLLNNSNLTPIIVAYRLGSNSTATGENRLFSLELLNSGAELSFRFQGVEKFRIKSTGEIYSPNEIYAYNNKVFHVGNIGTANVNSALQVRSVGFSNPTQLDNLTIDDEGKLYYYSFGSGVTLPGTDSGVSAGALQVLRSAGGWVTQVVRDINGRTYIRLKQKDESKWSSWQKYAFSTDKAPDSNKLDGLYSFAFARADLNPAVDLNTVNGRGIMCNPRTANATTARNYPMAEAGTLFYGTAAYGSANQIYGTFYSNRWFARGGGGGSSTSGSNANKTAWKEFAFLNNNVTFGTTVGTSITATSGYITCTKGWFLNDTAGTGLYNKALDARWNANGGVWNADKPIITNGYYKSTVATGTAPVQVLSTTTCTNLNADLLDGLDGEYYRRCQGRHNYVKITVGGDANTLYPVIITGVSDSYPATLLNITRAYNAPAPSTWNTSTHKGGLTLCILWNGSYYWDGNGGGAKKFVNVLMFRQTYSKMVGGIDTSAAGLVVWLRGGSAEYRIFSNAGTSVSASVKLSTYTDVANRLFAPKTLSVATDTVLSSYLRLYITSDATVSAEKLKTARTINGTYFDGTKNITTANWGTARNIYIRDAYSANTGTAVSVNGSESVYLKLPSTIKASLSGNASTATRLLYRLNIWGLSTDGYEDISGNMTGVGSITMNGYIYNSTGIRDERSTSAVTEFYKTWSTNSDYIKMTFNKKPGSNSGYKAGMNLLVSKAGVLLDTHSEESSKRTFFWVGYTTSRAKRAAETNADFHATKVFAGSTLLTSDIRLKNRLSTYTGDLEEKLKNITPFYYTMKGEDNTLKLGFSANDIKFAFPELVEEQYNSENPYTKYYYTVDFATLGSLIAIQGYKDLSKKIKNENKRISILEDRLANLTKKYRKLKRLLLDNNIIS